MAGSNADSYLALVAALERRDVEAVVALCDPEVEYTAVVGETFHGRDALRRWMTEFTETLAPTLSTEIARERGDLLLARGRARGHGAVSGAEVDWEFFSAMHYRDGLLFRAVISRDEAAAREAANVLAARAIYDGWQRGDFSSTELFHPDIEYVPADHGATYRGADALAEQWRDWLGSWEDFATEAEEIVASGDRVLVITRFRGRGRTSGIDVRDMHGSCLFTFEDGVVTRIELFVDPQSGRRAIADSP